METVSEERNDKNNVIIKKKCIELKSGTNSPHHFVAMYGAVYKEEI